MNGKAESAEIFSGIFRYMVQGRHYGSTGRDFNNDTRPDRDDEMWYVNELWDCVVKDPIFNYFTARKKETGKTGTKSPNPVDPSGDKKGKKDQDSSLDQDSKNLSFIDFVQNIALVGLCEEQKKIGTRAIESKMSDLWKKHKMGTSREREMPEFDEHR